MIIMKKILIVEDEKSLLDVLVMKFSDEGFEVHQARDGVQGLETAVVKKPDLILLDIIMPRMDGITMLKKLREDLWGKEVPVILLTNLGDSEKIAEVMEYGVYDYLVKAEWKMEELVERVKSRLKS